MTDRLIRVSETELTAKQASAASVALVLTTTVGLVGASVSSGTAAVIWAIGTVAAIVGLAYRMRRAPSGTVAVTLLITGIVVLSAGLPAVAVISESRGSSSTPAVDAEHAASPVPDPNSELRAALDKADELLPGGADSVLRIDIDETSTQVYVLDLAAGQSVYANYSRSSDRWYDPSRTPSRDRGESTFRRADLAHLDLTRAAAAVTAAADRIGIDRSFRHASDGIEVQRRSSDRKLVAAFSMSGAEVEVDHTGALPDNLGLVSVDGFLPAAEKLLRSNGIDPSQPVLGGLSYAVYKPTADAVPHTDPGTVKIDIRGGGRSGSLEETVGTFPVVRLEPDTGSASSAFALTAVTAGGIDTARADLVQRRKVATVDTHAISLEIGQDTSSSALRQRNPPPVLHLGLGPSSDAYYRLDGTFVRAD